MVAKPSENYNTTRGPSQAFGSGNARILFAMKISVIAHPNSKKPKVEKDSLGNWHVYVSASPHDDKANKAITESLAKYLGLKNSQVILLSGEKSRKKVFEVPDVNIRQYAIAP